MSSEHLVRIDRGTYPGRSPEIIAVPRRPHFFGTRDFLWTSHNGPWDYLEEVPLVFYGPGFVRAQGKISLDREVTVADVAPTLAELLDVPWPDARPGRPIGEALVPKRRRPVGPALVLVVVWDGGGTNVLDRWPEAWTTLAELSQAGTSISEAIVGSAPTVTPPVHTTIGTGAFPNQHGIVELVQRRGDDVADPFEALSPQNLLIPSFADLYDPRTGNEAEIGLFAEEGWQFGMMGHGAGLPGGDKDVAITQGRGRGEIVTNSRFYSLPDYLIDLPGYERYTARVDRSDSKLDRKWRGHNVLYEHDLVYSPVWTLYQTKLIKTLWDREGYGNDDITDLFFVNYKFIDHAGHKFNMVNDEVADAIRYSDEALNELKEFLDSHVGRKKWVVVVTADHGQQPISEATNGWPIDVDILSSDIAEHFDLPVDRLIEADRPMSLWLDAETMRSEDITEEEIADYVMSYTIEDSAQGREVPESFENRLQERLFAAAFPSSRLSEIRRCVTGK
ncbi:MAG: alkaline phosphatase family protein [Actinomycetota bacterium]|nr:alkaline phosphatase family protein [Actinomycetota bacterium]